MTKTSGTATTTTASTSAASTTPALPSATATSASSASPAPAPGDRLRALPASSSPVTAGPATGCSRSRASGCGALLAHAVAASPTTGRCWGPTPPRLRRAEPARAAVRPHRLGRRAQRRRRHPARGRRRPGRGPSLPAAGAVLRPAGGPPAPGRPRPARLLVRVVLRGSAPADTPARVADDVARELRDAGAVPPPIEVTAVPELGREPGHGAKFKLVKSTVHT